MTKDHIEEAISTERALDLALEALEYIENNYMSLPKSGTKAITAIKQARSAPIVQSAERGEPVAHCEAGPEHCQQCHLEDRSLALAAAVRYVKNNTPKLVSDEICMALASITAAQRPVAEPHKWTGLTDEDKLHIEIMGGKSDVMLAEMVEAKLKAKNFA